MLKVMMLQGDITSIIFCRRPDDVYDYLTYKTTTENGLLRKNRGPSYKMKRAINNKK